MPRRQFPVPNSFPRISHVFFAEMCSESALIVRSSAVERSFENRGSPMNAWFVLCLCGIVRQLWIRWR